jgi:hypothetical protein
MPYDGSGVWSPPAGTAAVSGATVASAKFNSVVADIQAALNDLRRNNLNVIADLKTFLGSADLAAARTSLGLQIGVNVQAHDAELAAIAGLASAANQVPYFTGAGAAALAPFSAFGRSLVDDADAAAAQTTLGLGALATLGSVATANIDNDAVTYAKMQNISATARFLGRFTAGAGDTEEVTGTQATTLLDLFTSGLKGLVPASGGGTTNFLRADGTFAAPAGGISAGVLDSISVFTSGGTWTRPTGCTKALMFVTGGGGGGGGSNAYTAAGGGGAGGTAIKYLDVTSIGSSTITIGTGGAGNTGTGNGTGGGNSSWADGTNTITGVGGSGGTGNNVNAAGGAGGTPTGGDLNIVGAAGRRGEFLNLTEDAWYSAAGGGSFWGGGGMNGANTPTHGGAGGPYGAGGGAGVGNSDGAAGAGGVVLVLNFK